MNEILFIVVTFISLSLVLVALRLGSHFLVGLLVAFLLIANLFASKLSIIFGVTSSLAIPLYAAIFLATDSAAEHYGKKVAYTAVWVGFFSQLCLVVFGQILILASHLEIPAVTTVSDSLSTLFGFIPRIVFGSFVAYLLSMNLDVYLYHRLKERFESKKLWLRNLVSTPISQAVDSSVFVLIAFYGVLPNLGEFILFVWAVKVAIAIVDTPFIYLSYRVLGKKYTGSNKVEVASDPQ